MRSLLTWLFVGLALPCMAALALLAAAHHPPIAAIQTPAPASFARNEVERGAVLATVGNCRSCHTAESGKPYAGGYAIGTDFGAVFSTNITPDPETGIGQWSLPAFVRAMRQGIARDGSQLLPVFPFDHYAKLDDGDLRALYAYLMTVEPVKSTPRANNLIFPYGIRALQLGWKALYLRSAPHKADASKSPAWNRGAYLVEALGACGACHTPRNVFGAEQAGHPLAGGILGHWRAPPLDVSKSPAKWTQDEFFSYLRGERTRQGRAIGPMATIVNNLGGLPDSDIEAIATYLVDGSRPASGAPESEIAATRRNRELGIGPEYETGRRLYGAHCAACHESTNRAAGNPLLDISLTTALWEVEPVNFLNVVFIGIGSQNSVPKAYMPSFRETLTADEVIAIGAYLRKSRTTQPSWTMLEELAPAIRSAVLREHEAAPPPAGR